MPDDSAENDARESTDGRAARETRTRRRRKLPVLVETVLLLAIALTMALVIKTFFLQAFYIPSPSMEPGLIKNDRILVQKVSYWFGGEPQRGDVIVFKDPGDWLPPTENDEPTSLLSRGLEKIGLYPSGGHLVKRVIGVPGDTIHCCNSAGELEINGVAVDESSFVKPGAPCDGPMVLPRCSQAGWTVGPIPAGKLFVMGDNRANSGDSSAHLSCSRTTCTGDDAFVPEDDVVGKVFALVWPIKRFTFVSRPDVFSQVPSP